MAGSFAGWYEKDMLYSLFTLLFLLMTVELLRVKALSVKSFAMFVVVGLLCIFLRNNGVYAVVPTAFAIIFFLKDKISKRLMIGATVGFIVLPVVINGPMFDACGIERGNVREALSIPMQQMARYMRDYGDEITEDERGELELFFNDYDAVSEVYDPFCADPVKNRVELQKGHKLSWLGTWAKLGLKHPGCYFDAFMCLNFGYLAPCEQNMEASWDMPTGDDVLAQMADLGIDGRQSEVRMQILQKLFYINMVFPFVRYLSMPGLYMWLTIVMLAIVIKHKGREEFVILLPNIVNLLVCLAAPLCNGMRYELPVVLSTPLVMAAVMRMVAGSGNVLNEN